MHVCDRAPWKVEKAVESNKRCACAATLESDQRQGQTSPASMRSPALGSNSPSRGTSLQWLPSVLTYAKQQTHPIHVILEAQIHNVHLADHHEPTVPTRCQDDGA